MRNDMDIWHLFHGPNAGYIADLYDRYVNDPASVPADLRVVFDRLPADAFEQSAPILTISSRAATSAQPISDVESGRVVAAARMARSIREYGHLGARLDPLGSPPPGDPMLDPATHGLTDADLTALPASIVWQRDPGRAANCLDAIRMLRDIYCGAQGYDFDHVQDFDERAWLHGSVESGAFTAPLADEERRALLERLTAVEGFERFLHTTFPGQKRFSIEGMDMLVPMLDEMVHLAAEAGAREVLIGMAHRGRLNVLAHVLGKPYPAIFSEFHSSPNKEMVPSEGSRGINYGWTGDVKYHLGARSVVTEGDAGLVQLTMAHNPSHLEFVNPVIQGFTRSSQDERAHPGKPTQDVDRALAVTIHGDAAFPGEGVVAESLNLSRLEGYQTGGSLHVIANNQIGFTTEARDGRSTLYASDLAKGFEIPIVHVNADDPEACLAAVRLAHAYRQRFHKDFLIDLVGYRRWGHNEGDEPAFTQPQMYGRINAHPTVRALYADQLVAQGAITPEDARQLEEETQTRLQQARAELNEWHGLDDLEPLHESPSLASYHTAVGADQLTALNQALLARPDGFAPNPKLERLLARRRERFTAPSGIDWAHAEILAFASILADATPIRMSGQDAQRGTFSQRHLVLHDSHAGQIYTPLQAIPQAKASFAVYNSPLSEAAVIGFEYGYSIHAPSTLVIWEAQFGDFANAGQVLIDQFIAAARAKWRQRPGLVMLLPHGYEGQGPEHSSGRVERYLQLAAEDNLRVVNVTSAAQYFHALRAQAASLARDPRPLLVMTPKSLLRHPLAGSSLTDLTDSGFQPVLDDSLGEQPARRVKRLILCSGKVWVDLRSARDGAKVQPPVAVARLEQLYPFPESAVKRLLDHYDGAREVIWLQEEPRNMGAWSYVAPLLRPLLPDGVTLRYIGRPARASTAEGLADVHAWEQGRIVDAAFAETRQSTVEMREGQHVG
ncbi:MAG TPA: 2-oxoglutarate dehydrogenase E1 component [Ktedonobacterales bacterium]